VRGVETILFLVVLGTVVAAVPASMAFVLGAVLASTDPVAVSALGRRLSLPPKVQALVQAESLFNDATSLVLFQIAVSFAVAGTAGTAGSVLLHAAGQFAILAAGGAAVGGVIAAGVIPVPRRVTDPVLETVLALITRMRRSCWVRCCTCRRSWR
jgi:NhaP-type Na+/H+ or K+/H+ antiporter